MRAANAAVERRMVHAEEQLELLCCPESEQSERVPILFVHGGHVGAWCWEEHFLPWFAAQGYPVFALSLRGHGFSGGRDRLNEFGLAHYARDVGAAAQLIGRPPVLIGHSMGALVVQKYLESRGTQEGGCAAAVLACPVPSFGLLPSSFAMAWTRPSLFAGMQSLASGGAASPEVLAEAMFAGEIDAEKLARIHGRMQRESRRALMDMSGWGLPQFWRSRRPDTLVLGASHDALIPHSQAQASAALMGAEYRLLEGLGHAVMMDTEWERAATAMHGWFGERGL